jgi:hypothetical protein
MILGASGFGLRVHWRKTFVVRASCRESEKGTSYEHLWHYGHRNRAGDCRTGGSGLCCGAGVRRDRYGLTMGWPGDSLKRLTNDDWTRTLTLSGDVSPLNNLRKASLAIEGSRTMEGTWTAKGCHIDFYPSWDIHGDVYNYDITGDTMSAQLVHQKQGKSEAVMLEKIIK